ncbi:L,D-transpeptidase [Pseudonocardia abyssalis]|uniref:L,D-transpeptidase n=1 Tax=Pseudonocardia abyssalis TaxID=2792008 RepID=A0ABS6UW90_9PSEU|nr:L,D-transpeptidase [Pseudonocardia abyssalis]MBW0116634.1 L,D-transpeptidase [Pseudonocardia abyssalis]MBW0136509.1 L,D-transpeptidase [Pseudonocardia abyssalis]
MRVRRVLALVVVVALTGLLSGAAGGAAPTAEAAVTAAVGLLPARLQEAVTAPAAPAPAAPAVPDAAPAAPVVLQQSRQQVTSVRVAPVDVPGTPCTSIARACVDLSGDQAWLLDDGGITYGPVPITSGRAGFRTPPGTFPVTFHSRDHVSSIYDAPMPYSVFFNGGIAFHQGSLSQLSHGCIHLSRTAAQEFFGSLDRGDLVQVVA